MRVPVFQLQNSSNTFWIPQPDGCIVVDLVTDDHHRGIRLDNLHLDPDLRPGEQIHDFRGAEEATVPQSTVDLLRGLIQIQKKAAVALNKTCKNLESQLT